jgi:hypothetical protein
MNLILFNSPSNPVRSSNSTSPILFNPYLCKPHTSHQISLLNHGRIPSFPQTEPLRFVSTFTAHVWLRQWRPSHRQDGNLIYRSRKERWSKETNGRSKRKWWIIKMGFRVNTNNCAMGEMIIFTSISALRNGVSKGQEFIILYCSILLHCIVQ